MPRQSKPGKVREGIALATGQTCVLQGGPWTSPQSHRPAPHATFQLYELWFPLILILLLMPQSLCANCSLSLERMYFLCSVPNLSSSIAFLGRLSITSLQVLLSLTKALVQALTCCTRAHLQGACYSSQFTCVHVTDICPPLDCSLHRLGHARLPGHPSCSAACLCIRHSADI